MTVEPYPIQPARTDRSLYATLAQFPAACFTLALGTDIAYWRTANILWTNFSAWLLFAGLIFGALAALVALVGILRRRGHLTGRGWLYYLGGAVALVLAIWNSFVHGGDGWTGVVPYGLALSAVTVAVMIVTALVGRPRSIPAYRAGRLEVGAV